MEFFSEMLESVGHEFMEEFFACCESVLADNGLLVLQVTSHIMLSQGRTRTSKYSCSTILTKKINSVC